MNVVVRADISNGAWLYGAHQRNVFFHLQDQLVNLVDGLPAKLSHGLRGARVSETPKEEWGMYPERGPSSFQLNT